MCSWSGVGNKTFCPPPTTQRQMWGAQFHPATELRFPSCTVMAIAYHFGKLPRFGPAAGRRHWAKPEILISDCAHV